MPKTFFLEDLEKEGKKLGIPSSYKRALIREYLQTKIIYYLYNLKDSQHLSFIGGTSLRLLRGLDRFSEDLDFDNLGLSFKQIKDLFEKALSKLQRDGFQFEFKFKKTDDSGIGEIKFIGLLQELGISKHPEEKLMIKIDYTTPSVKPALETLILSRFGLVQNVVTNSEEFMLAQKVMAILKRKDLQPRDFYDVVWFFSRNIQLSPLLFESMEVKNKKDLLEKLKSKYRRMETKMNLFQRRLIPFLIHKENIKYLDLFERVINKALRTEPPTLKEI